MPNKYHYDVKNCYYFPGTQANDGTISFDATKKRNEPGLRSIEFTPTGDIQKIRADGIDYIVLSSNEGYDITANFVMISDEFRRDCLVEVKDESTGIQYEDADAEFAPFALAGEFKGDAENIRWIFYNVKAQRPGQTGDNKETMKQPDEESITMKASPLPATIGGEEKNIVRAGVKKSDNATTWGNWFENVQLPGASSGPNS